MEHNTSEWDEMPDVEARVDALIAKCTLDQKIDLVSGVAGVIHPDRQGVGGSVTLHGLADEVAEHAQGGEQEVAGAHRRGRHVGRRHGAPAW